MNVAVIGGGWYGCHIARALLDAGHKVTLYEKNKELFRGASGSIPARLHLGYHYPRSHKTRVACQQHVPEFMDAYGSMTRLIPRNIYAVAAVDSLVDFGTYCQVCSGLGESRVIPPALLEQYGIQNVEGAVLTAERHVLIHAVRGYFTELLRGVVLYEALQPEPGHRLYIDCTFCSVHATGAARFEPCVTGLLEGPTDLALTIMDGPFPSLYPWDEYAHLNSLTSAAHTPLARCNTYAEAQALLRDVSRETVFAHVQRMVEQMARYYPAVYAYRVVDAVTGIRALPASGSDMRLVAVQQVSGNTIAVRAGKIDAVIEAARQVLAMIKRLEAK